MGGTGWLAEHGFDLLNALGVVGGLLFTAFTLREENRTRRIGNLIALTRNHREIWSQLFRQPELTRVLDEKADLVSAPVNPLEEEFVNLVIQHLNAAYHAMQDGLFPRPEGVRLDIRHFFSLPIPAAVWNKFKTMQDKDFVAFVESCRI